MLRRAALFFLLPVLAFAEEAPQETLLLQDPTVSETHVAFVYAGDLWIVGRSGGVAQRLTSHAGVVTVPRLSPDGSLVAFSAEYEGNVDVYVLPVAGGTPKRLTWHPSADRVVGWHPDGRRVLFVSPRFGRDPVERLYLVSADGGPEEELDLPKAYHAAYNADATRIACTPYSDAFRTWKRYRGGRTTPVWIYDPTTHEVEQVPHENATDTFPCWLGDAVYFASDRDGHMNLFRFAPGSKKVEQLTRFTDFDVRNVSAGGGVVAFEQAGAIHLYDPKAGAETRLRISVVCDDLSRLPRWEEVKGHVRSGALSPNGKRAVFEARGEIITMPREHGDPRNLSESPGAHDRSPVWSHDGKRIAWLSDGSGEYMLLVRDHLGREGVREYALGDGGFYYDPTWSPDDKHVLFHDRANRLAFVTLATGKVTEVARLTGSLGVVSPEAAWSPDNKWIAFLQRDPQSAFDRLCLYEVATGKCVSLTDAFCSAAHPAFSTNGRYLFFTASSEGGPHRFGLDMSANTVRGAKSRIYLAVLRKDSKNPLAPKSDEGAAEAKKTEVKKGGEKKEEPAAEDEEKTPEGRLVDVEGLDQRILALPIEAGEFHRLVCAGKALLYLEGIEGELGEIKSFDFEERKPKVLITGVGSFDVSADGKSILTESKGEWSFFTSEGKDKKGIAIAGVKVSVDPAQEWPEILREVWRIQRDYFYDGHMHGVDWDAMWTRWSAFLPYVRHRSDLNVLIGEMMGELCCGHEYVEGGEMPSHPDGPAVGLLGADLEVAEGKYRLTRIYRGQNWNAGLRAPLTEPGVDARVGDFLLSVNGVKLTAHANFYEAFAGTADRQTELALSAKADGSQARTVTVVPVASDTALRRQAAIEDNRRRVEELSGGRLAYIYMPDTGGEGLAAFTRDWFSQLDKQGVILDERYNRGGKIADYVIDVLSRDVMCYWGTRDGWLGRTPFGTIEGPKVMVVNERAGSGGDAMPWLFQRLKLGPLVGTRTWGGLVGISGYPPLMDGGSVTSAAFGIMDTEGNWVVENQGVTPDYEVVEWPRDVIAGHDPQLEKAVAVALESIEKNPPRKPPTMHPPAPR